MSWECEIFKYMFDFCAELVMAKMVHKKEELYIKIISKSGIYYDIYGAQGTNWSYISYRTL